MTERAERKRLVAELEQLEADSGLLGWYPGRYIEPVVKALGENQEVVSQRDSGTFIVLISIALPLGSLIKNVSCSR